LAFLLLVYRPARLG